MTTKNFNDLITSYRRNVYSSMIEHLAEQLSVSTESIQRLNPGFYPGRQSWVFAEYDPDGRIVGLQQRTLDGQKFMVEGSQRGLYFECLGTNDKDGYQPQCKFVRAYNAGVDCPLCGKKDWCLVSGDNPNDPSAVICGRTQEGAIKYIENAGYLHHLKANPKTNNKQILPESDKPYLIVEGVTDVLAAMDLGYTAIGRPSALAAHSFLTSLLSGKEIIVLGENDADGVSGMNKTFLAFKGCSSIPIRKCLPPSEYKDLREWKPSVREFEKWISENAEEADLSNVIFTRQPLFLTNKFLSEKYTNAENRTLHYFHNTFYQWDDRQYKKLDKNQLGGSIARFFNSLEISKGEKNPTEPLFVSKRFIDEIHFFLKAECFVDVPDDVCEPFYINQGIPLNLEKSIIFQNGILDVETDKLCSLTPDIFFTNTLPFDYNPKAICPLWTYSVNDNFNSDKESIDLLQEWTGYVLIATNFLQTMMMFIGEPRSGKSTTKNILEKLLGRARFSALDIHTFESRFGMAELEGKYLATISEQQPGSKYNADRFFQKIKTVTGADTIRIEQKKQPVYNTKIFTRLLVVLNSLPQFDDPVGALPPRLNLLHFPNNYEALGRADHHLEMKLSKELPGIAIWGIEGLKRLLKNKKFTQPSINESHLTSFKQLCNPLLSMVEECCDTCTAPKRYSDFYVLTNELFELHNAWFKYANLKPFSLVDFGRRLKAAFPYIRNTQKVKSGQWVRVYVGLKLKPHTYQEYLSGRRQ